MTHENTHNKAHSNTHEKIPVVPHKRAKGLKKLLKKAFVPMLFLGIMAMAVLSQPQPQQDDEVPPKKKTLEEIRRSGTRHKLNALENCAIQRPSWTISHIIVATIVVAIIALYVSSIHWDHILKEAGKDNSIDAKPAVSLHVEPSQSLEDMQEQAASEAVPQKTRNLDPAKELAMKKLKYWSHKYLSYIHYKQALMEVNAMCEVLDELDVVEDSARKSMVRALDCFKENKGACVMVTHGLWRESNSDAIIIEDNVLLIAQYVAIEGKQIKPKHIAPFVALTARKQPEKYVPHVNPDALTTWFEAAKTGDKKMISKLYGIYGDNIMIWGDDGEYKTALMLSGQAGQLDCVKHLVDLGANVHAKDSNGDTALGLCVKRNEWDTMKTLCQLGADPDSVDATEGLKKTMRKWHMDFKQKSIGIQLKK